MMTLLEQLGGRDAVELVVAAFYERVLADVKLKHYFRGVQMSKLQKNQTDFFCMALGGGDCYAGRDMRSVHKGMGITDEEFDAVAQHLSAALRECGVKQHHIDTILEAIAPLRADVVEKQREPSPREQFWAPAKAVCPVPHAKLRWSWALVTLFFMLAALAGAFVVYGKQHHSPRQARDGRDPAPRIERAVR